MVLSAQLETNGPEIDRRTSDRHVLRLRVPGSTPSGGVPVLIHDISTSGLLIQTEAGIDVGTLLDIHLPEVGAQSATVVWNRDRFFGCEFQSPLSKAGLSAALLKSYAGQEDRTAAEAFEAYSTEADKLPRNSRLMIIIALALASWAAVAAAYLLIRS
jgi:PilZ domain